MSPNGDIHARRRPEYAEPVSGRLMRKCLVFKATGVGFSVRDAIVYPHSVALMAVPGLE
jgi:hypothetical protein